jgi:hypothetical protein
MTCRRLPPAGLCWFALAPGQPASSGGVRLPTARRQAAGVPELPRRPPAATYRHGHGDTPTSHPVRQQGGSFGAAVGSTHPADASANLSLRCHHGRPRGCHRFRRRRAVHLRRFRHPRRCEPAYFSCGLNEEAPGQQAFRWGQGLAVKIVGSTLLSRWSGGPTKPFQGGCLRLVRPAQPRRACRLLLTDGPTAAPGRCHFLTGPLAATVCPASTTSWW